MAGIRVLRDDFDNVPDSRKAHKHDHAALHRAYNHAIYADDYDTPQDSINAAQSAGINRIIFTPLKRYNIAETLIVPAGMQLYGGGSFGIGGAEINATAEMDTMIQAATQTKFVGLDLDGNMKAACGIDLTGNRHVIEDNRIWKIGANGTDTNAAILCHAILYPSFSRNHTAVINGWALKGLFSDGSAYYGINAGLSTQNIWSGRAGAIWMDGTMTSISDDFEMAASVAVIKTGTIAGRLKLNSAYFEVTGSAPVLALNGSARAILDNCEAYGDATVEDRGNFIEMTQAYQLHVESCFISRFNSLATGISANGARLVVRDCVLGHIADYMPDNWNLSGADHVDLQWV